MKLRGLTRSSGFTVGTWSWQSQDSNPDLMILRVMVSPLENKHKAAKFPEASFSATCPADLPWQISLSRNGSYFVALV